MNIIVSLIILGIIGIVVYSMFTETIDDIFEKIKKEQQEQDDQVKPTQTDTGNTVDKTNTGRECNVRIDMVGSAYGRLLDNKVDLYHGTYLETANLGVLTGFHDNGVINYQWFCTGDGINSASWFDMQTFAWDDKLNSLSLQLNNVFESGDNVDLRFFVEGTSKTNGLELFAKQSPTATVTKKLFSDNIEIAEGTQFPYEYTVPVFLYDVPEDDYSLKFWNDDFKVNDRNAGHKFSYSMCEAGKSTC